MEAHGAAPGPLMTHFLKDILRQPEELRWTIELLTGPKAAGRGSLDAATAAIRGARHVYLTGIGSSWHAALNVSVLFHQHAHPVYLHDAAELLTFAAFPKDSAMIIISRSGKSTEIVQLARKARQAGVTVIGITNVPEGTLAKEAHHAIVVPIALDHAISVNTYTALALAAGMLATSVVGSTATLGCAPGAGASETAQARVPVLPNLATLAESLTRAFAEAGSAIPRWQEQIAKSEWLKPHSTTYFLARGSSLGSAYEARLMWEEGVKSAATAMGTGSFRHGPQEIVNKGLHFGMWIDGVHMREQDFALARDLRKLGASVMLIGQKVPEDAGDLVFQLPAIPAEWQFLMDIIPAQLVAERLAGLSRVDCDTFRLCSFIVEDEGGLLPKKKKN
ncbi:MAG TPA: SIS domain-containing protein [Candidatus Acidoferrum sp.]|nr:SIS domain-containing protein [Candidatus Acidoferrum sp.]